MFWLRKSGFVRQFGHLLVGVEYMATKARGGKYSTAVHILRGGGGGRHLDNSMKRCNITFKG